MIDQRPATDARLWRPQEFGTASSRAIEDPVVEPLWIGQRVLLHLASGEVAMIDAAGDAVRDEVDAIAAEVGRLALADSLVVDGYLTHRVTAAARPIPTGLVETMGAGEMTAQLFLGKRGRRKELEANAAAEVTAQSGDTPLAFVAVDLLAIDGTPLLAIPLLERKRLLESALAEGDLVRRTAFIRPPVDFWLATWRSMGFTRMAYKASNSRYAPGVSNDSWALARIPQH